MEGTVEAEQASLERELLRCVDALRSGKRFLIAMHEFPDGDALGSALALNLVLKEMGKEVVVYSPQSPPSSLQFLPDCHRIVSHLDDQMRFEVSIACDSGDELRLGPDFPDRNRRGITLNIDHHPRARWSGDVNLVDPRAAATGALVFRILERMEVTISLEVATCLWVCLVSDTGSFRHSNTNEECMRIAWALVLRGVKPAEIASRMFESQPLSRVRLLSRVLQTLSLNSTGQVAWVVVGREISEKSNSEETDGFISYPRSIVGVEVAMLLREEGERIRVSFRSRGRADVGAVAAHFGGGGHHNAAGCWVNGSFPQVLALVLREVEFALDRAN